MWYVNRNNFMAFLTTLIGLCFWLTICVWLISGFQKVLNSVFYCPSWEKNCYWLFCCCATLKKLTITQRRTNNQVYFSSFRCTLAENRTRFTDLYENVYAVNSLCRHTQCLAATVARFWLTLKIKNVRTTCSHCRSSTKKRKNDWQ